MKKKDILFGRNPILEALQVGMDLEQILIAKNAQTKDLKAIFEWAEKNNTPIRKVPTEKIQYVLYPFYKHERINHQGVIAFISDYNYQNIEDIYNQLLDNGKAPLFLYLDHITDVRNFGAIARSALCFDVDAIILPARNSVSVTADAQKTSAGALHHIPVCRTDKPQQMLRYLKDCGMQIVGASEKSTLSYSEVDFSLPTLIIFGAEGNGMKPQTIEMLSHHVTIPMNQKAFDSLNVSVSAGIILSKAYLSRV